jgi:NifU-like protein
VQREAESVIEQVIRPLVEADGGGIELLEVTRERVVVRLTGTCAGCPGKPYTVSRIIEPALRKALGSNVKVEARVAA